MKNLYYSVNSPLMAFKHIGQSASNTYIGSSRSINTVMETIILDKGCELHSLVGGLFLVRDGIASPVSLLPPKSVLEGLNGREEVRILLGYIKSKRISATDTPTQVDYRGARRIVSENRMPDLHPAIIRSDHSPEFILLRECLTGEVSALRKESHTLDWSMKDISAYGWPQATLNIDGEKIEFCIYPDLTIRMILPVKQNLLVGDDLSKTDAQPIVDMTVEDAKEKISEIFHLRYRDVARSTPKP